MALIACWPEARDDFVLMMWSMSLRRVLLAFVVRHSGAALSGGVPLPTSKNGRRHRNRDDDVVHCLIEATFKHS